MKRWKVFVRIDNHNNHRDIEVTANSEAKARKIAEAKCKTIAKTSNVYDENYIEVTRIERINDNEEEIS